MKAKLNSSPRSLAVEARKHAVEMLAVLSEIARDQSVAATSRIAAANALLDRAYGRPGGGKELEDFADDPIMAGLSFAA